MKREKSNGKGWVFTGAMITAIVVLSVFTAGIAVVSVGANEKLASVTRDLPDYVEPNEEFVVTLTQSGFLLGAGVVWEVLPGGFEYVDGSYTGGGDVDWDPVTRTLMMQFFGETSIAYRANAGSNDQTAGFSGTYRAIVGDPKKEEGAITGDTVVVVDGTPPYTDEHNPAKGATGVPVDTNVVVHVKDNFEVDPYTIEMTVNGNPVSPSIIPAGLGTTNDWVVRYNPLVNFGSGEVVTVTVDASDEAGNAMPADVYSFTTVGPPVPRPDLIVTAITPNCGGYLFANESNTVNATVKNNGTADAGAFNVSFDIDGFGGEVRVISGLAMGASEEVMVTDTTERDAGDSVTITVTADCDGEITESDETNNILTNTTIVVNNGYKNKSFMGMDSLELFEYDAEMYGGVVYNVSGTKNYPFEPAETDTRIHHIDIPAGMTVKKARLYVYWYDYWGNPSPGYLANLSVNFIGTTFNTPDKMYTDQKGFGTYNTPKGTYAYDVTTLVTGSGDYNVVVENIDPTHRTTLLGEMLLVVYEDPTETKKIQLWIMEGNDLLKGDPNFCVTPEEATATVAFPGTIVDMANKSAMLISVVAQGMEPGSDMIFNGAVIKPDAWDTPTEAYPNSKINVESVDITANLSTGGNSMGFQDTGTMGMQASNAILVVETIKGVPPTNLTAEWNQTDNTVNVSWDGMEGGWYDIYISNNYTAGFSDNPNTTVQALSWIDTNAASYPQRYYKVGLNGSNWTNETVGKFNIPAYTDWNWISTPLLLNDTSLSVVIRDAGVGDNIFDYDNVGGLRTSVYVGGGTWIGPVQTFEPEKGYKYQNVGAADFNITAVGDVPTGNITTMLYLNWNLVGYTSVNTSSVSIVTGAGVGDNIFDYDNVGGLRTSVYVGGDTWIGPVQTFEPGRGYEYQAVVADFLWEYTA